MPQPVGRLHVLTDFFFQQRYTHGQLARLLVDGGADVVQVRQKAGGPRHRLLAAQAVAQALQGDHVQWLVDDDVAIAAASGAHGVHLGQTDLPVPAARRVLGEHRLVGATATTAAQALQAQHEGADYIGFGPVFTTRSKDNPASVKGLVGLRAACEAVSIPVIAIAGITTERIVSVLEAGAHGVAVLSEIVLADDPEAATAAFRAALDEALGA